MINLIYILSLLIILIIIIYFSWFLYSKFYLSLMKIGDIYQLQSEVSIETINTKLYDEIEKNIEDKKNKKLPDFNTINNPFY